MRLFLLFISTLMFTSCGKWYQFVNVSCKDLKSDGNACYYENDSIKIQYYFWAERGVMGIEVFNKLNVPLYIDWKKSSYINNSTKLDYWIDEEEIKSVTYYQGYSYSGNFIPPNASQQVSSSATTGVSVGNAKKTRLERVTFMPPNSTIFRHFMHLTDFGYVEYNKNSFVEEEVTSAINPRKKTKIYRTILSEEKTFLKFRNYMTFSTSEKFENEFHVDNSFYADEVAFIKGNEFHGESIQIVGSDGVVYTYKYPYKKGNRFYYNYPYDLQ